MKFRLVNPASTSARKGNNITSERWASILRDLEHSVELAGRYDGESDVEVLLSLHAKKSAESVKNFKDQHPERPVVLALTGTDLYRDLEDSEEARASVERADRLVVLQPKALEVLKDQHQDKTHIIHQSVSNVPESGDRPVDESTFMVLQLAHVRSVKDPLRLPYATRKLPKSSALHAFHLGGTLDVDLSRQLQKEADNNGRFTRLGQKPRPQALQYLKGADLMVLSSRLEGGANVISEAIACGTPVLASDVPGNRGLIGEYPGYFSVGDESALADKLLKAESDDGFYRELREEIEALEPLVDPSREKTAWKELIDSL